MLTTYAVLAESYERIRQSNLVGMGVLSLEFKPAKNRESLGLTGQEVFDVEGGASLTPRKQVTGLV